MVHGTQEGSPVGASRSEWEAPERTADNGSGSANFAGEGGPAASSSSTGGAVGAQQLLQTENSSGKLGYLLS